MFSLREGRQWSCWGAATTAGPMTGAPGKTFAGGVCVESIAALGCSVAAWTLSMSEALADAASSASFSLMFSFNWSSTRTRQL